MWNGFEIQKSNSFGLTRETHVLKYLNNNNNKKKNLLGFKPALLHAYYQSSVLGATCNMRT